ncbi:NADPH-dependent FMN reductase [Tepidiforma sp.]|uniref:NADPH-dependent FMN reductase n=1 Tax=Tepidiforma sp. TaxID=2682230 RepID=UPI002ADE7B45|nr:NAD(P)H-dependent oxidoreductase [Tepidiforma sp.]
MVRILGVNGSLRAGSTADRALQYALGLLRAEGAACETFDIGGLTLLDGRPDDAYPPSVAAWREACRRADGFVIAVPSYHGAMPGGLKNALDFIDAPEAGGKPFAVIAIAGGSAEPGGTDVTRVMRHIGGLAVAPDVVVSRAAEHWGKGPEPADPDVAAAVERSMRALFRFCLLREAGSLPGP